jgi:hypothetical protein
MFKNIIKNMITPALIVFGGYVLFMIVGHFMINYAKATCIIGCI